MNLASLLVALSVLTSADTTGDPVLLDFQATWCGPCKQMRPEVEKLIRKGYPVREIDIDRSPEMSERYQVKAVPTFVIVDAKGKELARTKGVLPAAQLAAFYNETKLNAASTAPAQETQERDAVEDSPDESAAPSSVVNPKPWETVVRIKMHLTDREWGFGSGTIIYSDSEESIILTCAHIFRLKDRQQPSPKNFRVPISVDLFDGQFVRRQPAMLSCSERDIPGQAIDYDFVNDVGLIRIRPGRKLAASKVVPTQWRPQKGMSMYTVGCSHGQDATAWDTKILDPRVGMSNTSTKESFATIKCAHQPKEGRSGGGLYTPDGYVAGVCDFADPNEKVGLYAVPESIHRLLDRNQLTALYKPPTTGEDVSLASNRVQPKSSTGTRYRTQSPDESTNPEDVTLPPPRMVGIANPPTDAKARWASSPEKLGPKNARRVEKPGTLVADSGESRPRPGTAQTTDLTGDPGADAAALEGLNQEDIPRSTRPIAPQASTPRPGASGWRSVRQNSSSIEGTRSSNR